MKQPPTSPHRSLLLGLICKEFSTPMYGGNPSHHQRTPPFTLLSPSLEFFLQLKPTSIFYHPSHHQNIIQYTCSYEWAVQCVQLELALDIWRPIEHLYLIMELQNHRYQSPKLISKAKSCENTNSNYSIAPYEVPNPNYFIVPYEVPNPN